MLPEHTIALPFLLTLLAAAAGCKDSSREPAGLDRIVPLHPVEASTGLPSAPDAMRVDSIARIEFGKAPNGLRLIGVQRVSAQGEPLEIELLPQNSAAPGEFPCVLLENLGWRAQDVERLTLEARLERGGEIRVHFGTGKPPAPIRQRTPPTNVAAFELFRSAESAGIQRREASVALRPDWSGQIDWIAIQVREAYGRIELSSLEATKLQLPAGAAVHIERNQELDAGLITLPGRPGSFGEERPESERAFPLRSGEPNVVDIELDGPAVLYGSFAPFPRVNSPREAVEFVARLEGHSKPLWSAQLEQGEAFRGWLPFQIELPEDSGEVRIEFEANTDQPGAWAGLLGSPHLHFTSDEQRPSLLMITADTLRADYVGALRKQAGLDALPGLATPNLDALAARGSLFTDVLSASNATLPSHASLFTGRTPRDHGVIDNRHKLASGNFTLPEHLSANGWHTVHASAVAHLNSQASGLGQGVARYLEVPVIGAARVPFGTPPTLESLDPELQKAIRHQGVEYGVPRAIHELAQAGDRPTYLWLHLFDPHTPYVPSAATLERLGLRDGEQDTLWLEGLAREVVGPAGTTEQAITRLVGIEQHLTFATDVRDVEFARALYAASVSQMDEGLGDLFETYDQPGRELDLIAFTSDHGESLGERGVWFGHSGIYQNTLQVPLILAGGNVPKGAVFDGPVSSVDLASTLAELLGAPAFESPDGTSLVPWLEGALQTRATRWFQHTRDRQVGYRDGSEHVVWSREPFQLGVNGKMYQPNTLERLLPAPLPSGVERTQEVEIDQAALSLFGGEIESWLADRSRAISGEGAILGSEAEAALDALGYTD